jgi:hypothetical protein
MVEVFSVVFFLVISAVSFKLGFSSGMSKGQASSNAVAVLKSLRDRLEDTGIAKFGRKNPNKTDYERGFISCLDTVNDMVDKELSDLLDTK